MISYAQNGEDVLLARCFPGRSSGFYIDVGANSPVLDSVTFHFHQLGWRGVNVEPLPWRHRELVRYRPRDINLQAACGAVTGRAVLRADPLDGLSAFERSGAEAEGDERLAVDVTTLALICEQHAPDRIDFLKVDVEGAERAVLEGADFQRFRPAVVVVEATKPNSPERNDADWEMLLTGADYLPAYFDGLNRYFVSREESPLIDVFATPPNVFDHAVRYASFGHVFDDRRHPDHSWGRAFAERLLRAGYETGPALDVTALTFDLRPSQLDASLSDDTLSEAYSRALGRVPEAYALAQWRVALGQDVSVRTFYEHLVRSEEFLHRRARALAP